MLTLNPSNAVISDTGGVIAVNDNGFIINEYSPSAAYAGMYWNVPAFTSNVIMPYSMQTSDDTYSDTAFMIFGAANDNDPYTASNSVYVEMCCVSGKVVFKLCKRVNDTLTTQVEPTTNDWYTGSIKIVNVGLNSITQKLKVRIITGAYIAAFELSIPTYSFNRIYGFNTTVSAANSVTSLAVNGNININYGFIYNKNKTIDANMLDFIKERTGLSFTNNDITYINIRESAPEDLVNNTRVDLSGSGNDVLIGASTLSYSRINIGSFKRLSDNYLRLTLASPFTAQSIITAYNTQYGMNLTTDDVELTPSADSDFTEETDLVITAVPNNLCLTDSAYITLYHPV